MNREMAISADCWDRLSIFLLLGSEAGVYSVGSPELSLEDCPALLECLRADGKRAVKRIVEAMKTSSGASRETALFALAVASSAGHADESTAAAALAALPAVAPSAADLCVYAAHVQQLRGWGRGLRTAISRWYAQKGPRELAREVIRSRQRAGWSNRDMLRMAHPKAASHTHQALFRWILTGEISAEAVAGAEARELQHIHLFERAKQASSAEEIVHLIEDDHLPEDLVPVRWKQHSEVWEALLYAMPYESLMRNLPKMTETGMLGDESEMAALVVARLVDRSRIRSSAINPLALLAMRAYYEAGTAAVGKARWTPVPSVLKALDEAFHSAVQNVQPTGKRLAIGIDASSSMLQPVAGSHGLSCATAAAAIALIAVRRESSPSVCVFGETLEPLHIGKNDRLCEVVEAIPFAEICSNPSRLLEYARERGMEVNGFLFLTSAEEVPAIPVPHVVVRASATMPSKYAGAEGRVEILGFDPAVLPLLSAIFSLG